MLAWNWNSVRSLELEFSKIISNVGDFGIVSSNSPKSKANMVSNLLERRPDYVRAP
jgi:hypothetical protein